MERLSPPLRRALALGLLALPPILGGLLAYGVYVTLDRQSQALDLLGDRIAALEERIATREKLLSELRLMERSTDLKALLVEAPTAPLAQADLQGQLGATIEGAGARLASIQTLPPEDVEGFTRLPLKVAFESDMGALREVLHAIETAEPAFIVTQLQVDPVNMGLTEDGVRIAVAAEVAAFSKSLGETAAARE